MRVLTAAIACLLLTAVGSSFAAEPLPPPGKSTLKQIGEHTYVSGVNCPGGVAPCSAVTGKYFDRVEEVRVAGTGSCLRTVNVLTGVLRAPTLDPAITIELPQYQAHQEYFMCQPLGPSDPGAACAGI